MKNSAVGLDRAKALDPQPTLRGFGLAQVFVAHLHGVVDRGLGPHLAGPSVDTSAAVHRVALENVRELLEIHGQWRQRQSRSCADEALEMVGQEIVAVPATLTQRRSARRYRLPGTFDTLIDGSKQTVAEKLEHIRPPQHLGGQGDDGWTISAVVSTAQRRPPLPGLHGPILNEDEAEIENPSPGQRRGP